MTQLKYGCAVLCGTIAPALMASLLSTSALAEPPVDLSKWSPEYVRSIAGTEEFDTAEACGKVTPLDYKGGLTFWYQGVFEGDPDLGRRSRNSSSYGRASCARCKSSTVSTAQAAVEE